MDATLIVELKDRPDDPLFDEHRWMQSLADRNIVRLLIYAMGMDRNFAVNTKDLSGQDWKDIWLLAEHHDDDVDEIDPSADTERRIAEATRRVYDILATRAYPIMDAVPGDALQHGTLVVALRL